MKQFKLTNLIFNALVIFVIGLVFFAPTFELAVASLAIGAVNGTLLSFVPNKLAFMAIQVEIWQNHIEQEIFKDNQFLTKAHSANENVIGGKAVHIPQSGGSGNVQRNRSQLPATVRRRTDTDVIYLLDEYTSDPVLIPNIDLHELSYDKRNSVLGEDRDKIVQDVADYAIYNWLNSPVYQAYGATSLPASNIMETTGDIIDATASGATGKRRASTLKDLQRMKTNFKNNRRWFNGKMYALLSPIDEEALFPADTMLTATYMASVTEAERREGVMYKVQGWNIMTRSSVARINGAGTIIDPAAVGSADDDEASLFWYQDAVEFAMGDVVFFDDMGNPVYYGDVYSFLVRAGGRARRADYNGVALLKQAKEV